MYAFVITFAYVLMGITLAHLVVGLAHAIGDAWAALKVDPKADLKQALAVLFMGVLLLIIANPHIGVATYPYM